MNPADWCTTSVRTRTSSDRPVSASVNTSPLPTSIPAPVSASPPSCRSPISTLGVSDTRPPTVKPREPSSAVRTRVTPASDALNRPAAPSTSPVPAPTHSASALNASANPPVAREPISSPRVPAAVIAIDRPVSSVAAPAGARLSAPVP